MKNYNIQYLKGNRHIDDKRYQELMAEEGVEIPDEYLNTPEINKSFIDEDPEWRTTFVRRKLAENGLLGELK